MASLGYFLFYFLNEDLITINLFNTKNNGIVLGTIFEPGDESVTPGTSSNYETLKLYKSVS